MTLIGVDVGGTFTDTVVADDDGLHAVKTPTTNDLISGIVNGFELATEESGIGSGDVDAFNHGSTVALNALIEGEGAETALVTSEGFGDILEIGDGFRDSSLLYAPCGDHEPPLVPRKHRYEIAERRNAAGEVVTEPDLSAVDDLVDTFSADGIESVAVSFLHSYQDPSHERQVAERIRDRNPSIDVSISGEVSPEIREYPRTASTAVDAYIKPRISTYVSQLQDALVDAGLEASLNIMKSDGGLAGPSIAAKRPVTQIISGPVAGVKAAQHLGQIVGIENLITFDMGGTSCDTAMIESGNPIEVPDRTVRGMKVNGPFVNINTIGAGGGSIAWLNEVDSLRVGPQSSGAEPGPACYGRGGTRPTVTDADLVLGLLNAEEFAGGSMELDAEAARTAIETHIAEPLGMSLVEAASAIRDIVDNKMAGAIRVISVNEGTDPRNFALMGFGGAGPMHACNIATELDIDTVVFPNNPGVISATGLLVSDIKHEYRRSLVQPMDEADPDRVTSVVDELITQGHEEMDTEDVPMDDRSFAVSFDLMYTGQAHYLNIDHEGTDVTRESLDAAAETFERRHQEQYGFVDESSPIEIVNVRVTATGEVATPTFGTDDGAGGSAADAEKGTREVHVDADRTVETPYYDWDTLGTGAEISGPSIVELSNSTIWIPPSFEGSVDEYRNLIAEREDAE